MQIVMVSSVSVCCAHSPGLRYELYGRRSMFLGEPALRGQGTLLGRAVVGSEHVGTLGSLWFCLLAVAGPEQLSQACPGPLSV